LEPLRATRGKKTKIGPPERKKKKKAEEWFVGGGPVLYPRAIFVRDDSTSSTLSKSEGTINSGIKGGAGITIPRFSKTIKKAKVCQSVVLVGSTKSGL